MAMSNYHPLLALKINLGDHKFKDDCEMETVVTWWWLRQGTYLYQQGIEKLLPQYDECLISGWDCVGK
jgi:hypothetical protein